MSQKDKNPLFDDSDKILILGNSGCGKSKLSKVIQVCYPRIWVIDTLEEYGKDNDGYEVVRGFDAFFKKYAEIRATKPPKYKIAIQLDAETQDLANVYNEIMRQLYKLKKILVVTEEIQEFTSPQKMPHWLRRMILTGRHRDIALIWTTQRVGYCNKTLASQCAHIFAGRIFEFNDLNYLKKIFGPDAEKLKDLDKFYFYHWQPCEKKSAVLVKNTLTK